MHTKQKTSLSRFAPLGSLTLCLLGALSLLGGLCLFGFLGPFGLIHASLVGAVAPESSDKDAAASETDGLRRFEITAHEMGTTVRMVFWAPGEAEATRASEAALARIRALNSVFSTYDASSEVRRLSDAHPKGTSVPVSEDLWRVLARAEEISRASKGAFDVTVGPIVRLWRSARTLRRLPDPEILHETLGRVGHRLVRMDPEKRTVALLEAGMQLDFGAVAKGYAAAEAVTTLREAGVPRSLVEIGGDIATGLAPPGQTGWKVAIGHHEGGPAEEPTFWLVEGAIASSGDSEQHAVIDGRRYSHIVDPRTGLGLVDGGRTTVVARDGMTADALATATGVLAPDEAIALIEATPGAAGRIIRRVEGKVVVRESTGWQRLPRVERGDATSVTSVAAPKTAASPSVAASEDPPVPAPGAAPVAAPASAAVAAPAPVAAPVPAVVAAPTPVPVPAPDPLPSPVAASAVTPAPAPVPAPVPARVSETSPNALPAPSLPSDLTTTPPTAWMLEPVPLPEAAAKTDADMKPYTERIPGSDASFDMVPIPGGKFTLGSPESEADRCADEGPSMEVEIEPFWMGKCEVTWKEYELWGLGYDALREKRPDESRSPRDTLADAISRPTKPYADMTFGMGRDGYPAICMTHLAAKVYTKWLSAKTGRYYRLATEAEWEYACRAGSKSAYSFGDDPKTLPEYAWFYANGDDKYHEVGKKKPNAWGLHDMHGNVAEWVLDQYVRDGYAKLLTTSHHCPLLVPETIYPRSVRGGSYMDDPKACRSAARRGSSDDFMMGDPQMPKSIWYHTDARFVGFRVVRPLRVPKPEEAVRYDLDEAQKQALADYLEFLAGKQ